MSVSQKEYALDCQVLKLLCDRCINEQEYGMLKTEIKNYLKTLNLLWSQKTKSARAFLRWEEKEIGGYIVPCISLDEKEERLTSDICMAMYRDKAIIKSGYPFVACINSDGKTVSLRSDKNGNNFDVSAIARRFGGGGHRNASGFKLK